MIADVGNAEPGTVTGWYLAVQGGDAGAASRLFDLFFGQMVRQAARQLGPIGRADPASDEEDLALSALDSFFAVIRRGPDERTRDRHSLWGLLHQILRRKVYDRLARRPPPSSRPNEVLDSIAALQPDPETVAEMRDLMEQCLGMLEPINRQIAVMHLDGHSLSEISGAVDLCKSTVGLKIQEIYKTWRRRFGDSTA